MAKVEGMPGLLANLGRRANEARRLSAVAVIVGFTAAYALIVHEDLEAHHPVGMAKYLEQPARTLGGVLGGIVRTAVAAGRTILDGLLLAGLRLQREAQLLCPVDTGALRASAFTRVEK